MPLSYSYLDEMRGVDMTESEFDGLFHPTSANPRLPVRVVNVETDAPVIPFDPLDDDDDPPTLRLEDLANAPADAPHSSEMGNLSDNLDETGEL